MTSLKAPVGLIAGAGKFPAELARSARRRGYRVVAVGLRDLSGAALADDGDELALRPLGAFEPLVGFLREAGVRDVVLAGKVPKRLLWERPESVRPDALALRVLAGLADHADDSLLGAFVVGLESQGLRVLPQTALGADLLAEEGPLGERTPTPEQWSELAFGWPIARALGGVDVGQTVVVKDRAVLALEAVEGTDEAIRRGCALGPPGACVVKVAKPSQDPRFDVPGVGPETVRVLAEGGGSVLAVEAGATFVLQREIVVREAEAAGIAVVGISEASLAREQAR